MTHIPGKDLAQDVELKARTCAQRAFLLWPKEQPTCEEGKKTKLKRKTGVPVIKFNRRLVTYFVGWSTLYKKMGHVNFLCRALVELNTVWEVSHPNFFEWSNAMRSWVFSQVGINKKLSVALLRLMSQAERLDGKPTVWKPSWSTTLAARNLQFSMAWKTQCVWLRRIATPFHFQTVLLSALPQQPLVSGKILEKVAGLYLNG